MREFFATLPLALESDLLRIVHACWDDGMIGIARDPNEAISLYELHRDLINKQMADDALDAIDKGLRHQNRNPVKLLTSGPEERTDKPITAGGRVRNEQRVSWWNNYRGAFCMFGHYSIADGHPRGNGSAFCVDFGVGHRWKERRAGKASGFSFRLGAVRFPERDVIFDNGEIRAM